MNYKTLIPTWTKETGDSNKEARTADILNKYSIYGREESHASPLVLFAIGGKREEGFSDNWDIYADKNGTLYSIPRNGSGCSGTYFGDVNHIKNLMRKGHFSDTLTIYGLKMMYQKGAKTA